MSLAPTVIVNAGAMFSGDVERPVIDAEALRIENGRIVAIGSNAECVSGVERVIDAMGSTVAPGLVDSHCHVVFGDYTPRQSSVGFLSSYVHGGITQVVSPGEIHLPGRPHDRAGVKALAVIAQRSWSVNRPNGMKVHGGSIVLEPSLTEEDFVELRAEGVQLAKFGFGDYEDPLDGARQTWAARAAGMTVMCHSGGASIPGSKPITAEHLRLLNPHVAGHINGGPTSLPDEELAGLVADTEIVLELVQAGCLRSSLFLIDRIVEVGAMRRVVVGSDTPTGTGVMPLGVLKSLAELCSLGGVSAPVAWAWATGNTTEVYGLTGGRLEVGRSADIVVCDAPWGSQATSAAGALERGDVVGISMVMIDGVIRVARSRNTPTATRSAVFDPPVGELAGSGHVS